MQKHAIPTTTLAITMPVLMSPLWALPGAIDASPSEEFDRADDDDGEGMTRELETVWAGTEGVADTAGVALMVEVIIEADDMLDVASLEN